MRHFFTAGLLALSFMFSSQVMAKDIPSIDLFSGDYIGVVGVDVDQLAKRDVYKKVIADPNISGKYQDVKTTVDKWTAGALTENDIDLMIVAIPSDYNKKEFISIVEAKKNLKELVPALEAEIAKQADKFERREVNNNVFYIEKRSNSWLCILDDKRFVAGSEREVKAVVASQKANKAAKPLKNNAKLYKQYQAADKKTDVWGAYVLTAENLKDLKDVTIPSADGKSTFRADEMQSANFSLNLVSGLVLNVVAKMKSDAAASAGSAILNENLNAVLGDPALNDMGLGFLKTAVKVSSSKSDLKGTLDISSDNMSILEAFAAGATSSMKTK